MAEQGLLDLLKNERDYAASTGMKTSVAAMSWAITEIERLRALVQADGAELDRLQAVARDREQQIAKLTESK